MDSIYQLKNLRQIMDLSDSIPKVDFKPPYHRYGEIQKELQNISNLNISNFFSKEKINKELKMQLELVTDIFSGVSVNQITDFYNSLPNYQTDLKKIKESNNDISANLEEMRELLNIAYQASKEENTNNSNDLNDQNINNGFSSSQELEEAFEEHIKNPIGFQEKVANWTEQMKKQYFIFYLIISIFIIPWLQENVGLPVTSYVISNVKKLPEKGAEIICKLGKGIEAVITENVDYYYKVKFIDENGIEQEGYVAKKNLKIISQDVKEEE